MSEVITKVAELLREAAAQFVLPVYGEREARPEEKSPGEWVTTADRAAEAFLAPALVSLLPGSLVVGEESASSDERILVRLTAKGWVWLLDPLDGTANFAAGVEPFSMMAALLRDGEAVVSWMLNPVSETLCVAEVGSGAWENQKRVSTDWQDCPPEQLSGAVLRRFLPELMKDHIAAVEGKLAGVSPGSRCAGHDYPGIASGELDFALYWRTLPWDHIPGALFLAEAGGKVARLDGTPYVASEHERPGLLAARSEGVWMRLRDLLAPPDLR